MNIELDNFLANIVINIRKNKFSHVARAKNLHISILFRNFATKYQMMRNVEIHSCPELMEYIQQVGFLPLLDSGVRGYSAEDVVDEDCRYVVMDDGGWDWPLWKWKGPIVTEGRCVYGKFFAGKAGFVSREWWPDLCNYRRASRPAPVEGSIDEAILLTLAEHGSLITRELRAACGFDGPKMRSKFDGYVTRLQFSLSFTTVDFLSLNFG